MRSRLARAALVALAVPALARGEPPVPTPRGFVTDLAGVISPPVAAHLTALAEELRQKTGAEIAVVTVETTAPLDDFTYAMRIADAWKPGRKGEDTGVVFLVATRDRKLRVLVGYGLEPILPDGLVGQIEDDEVVPAFRAGRIDEGIWRGVAALARRIARARGVELGGAPPRPGDEAPGAPTPLSWVAVLVILLFFGLVLSFYGRRGVGGYYPIGFGGFGGGGFSGGGGGFGGFGGGSFGGGGAGRSW